jgi:hypothetical protein
MRKLFQTKKLLILIFCTLISYSAIASKDKTAEQIEHDKWLKSRFSEQHKKLIPIVAVANMLFACDKAKNSASKNYQVKKLVEDMGRDSLAEKLIQCLAGENMKSDVALNFGLYGCFYEQLENLPQALKQEKMRIVGNSIASLSREERQKSFSRCVTDQAISYLK